MIICLTGLREPSNIFKNKIASYFNAPIVSFSELSNLFFESINKIYGEPTKGTKISEEMKIQLRTSITEIHPKVYMDWMSNKLIADFFSKEENSTKKIHCVIPDLDSEYEYRFLRDYLLVTKRNNYGAFRKTNKMILVENDDLLGTYYNKDYTCFRNFQVDEVVSTEDEDPQQLVREMIKRWRIKVDKIPE